MREKERIIESRDSTALFPSLLGLWVPPLGGGTIPPPFEYLNQKPWLLVITNESESVWNDDDEWMNPKVKLVA